MPEDTEDAVLDYMRKIGLPITRASYIEFNWGANPPEWSAELEATLPPQLQDWSKVVRDD